jgi:hypothetical protein
MLPEPLLAQLPHGQLLDADRLQPDWPQATVLFSDDSWRPATIIAWCRYRLGWAVLIRWADSGEDWRLHDPEHPRRSAEHLGGWANS